MDIALSHARNPVLGWDIQVIVKAGDGESITFARIEVNGFPEVDQQISPPLNKWQKTLTQQGQFPGDNKVFVTISNDKGVQSNDEDEWE